MTRLRWFLAGVAAPALVYNLRTGQPLLYTAACIAVLALAVLAEVAAWRAGRGVTG